MNKTTLFFFAAFLLLVPYLTHPINATSSFDQGQTIHINDFAEGGVPPYTYNWLVETPGSTKYTVSPTSICQTPSGQQPAPNVTETCTFVTNTTTKVGEYQFIYQATDSASHPQTTNSSPAQVQLNKVPTVSISAASANIVPGQGDLITASLENGTGAFTVNFIENGNIVATNTMVPINGRASFNFVSSSAGIYTLSVSATDTGTVHPFIFNSSSIKITVSKPLGFGSPSITIPNSSIDEGESEQITANVMGGIQPYSFVWTLNGKTLGQTTQAITFNGNASDLGNDIIKVTVTDSNNNKASATGNVTVNTPPNFGNPFIIIPNSTIDEGQSEQVTANVFGGTLPYSFVWTLNGNTLGQNTQTITFNGNASDLGNDTLHVKITDHAGETNGAPGLVTVNKQLSVTSVIIPNSTIDVGQSETVTANVAGGTAPYSYAWTVNGKSISQNTKSITFNANTSDIGNDIIKVTVTDHVGETASNTGTVTVNSKLTLGSPSVIVPNSVINEGQSEQITANVSGGVTPYSFVWTLNGKTLGQTTKTITFNGNASDLGTDNLGVTVTDHSGQTATGSGTVTVNKQLGFGSPSITIPNSTIDVGQSEVVEANVVGGTAPYSFVWTLNGNQLSQTSQSITFHGNTSDLGADTLKVIVTDKNSQTASATGTITVNNAITLGSPSVLVPNSVINEGQSEAITANVIGGTQPYSYVWKLNGKTLIQATKTITFNGNVSDLGTDNLQVTVTDAAKQSATGSGTVTVNNAIGFGSPSITIPNSIIDVGQSEVITANVMGGTAPYTFAWTLNGKKLSPTTQSITFNGNTSDVGNDVIGVTVTDHNSQSASATGNVIVNTAFSAPTPTPASQIVDQGQTANMIESQPTTGSGPYTYNWMELPPGNSLFVPATNCAVMTSIQCLFATTNSTPTGQYSFLVDIEDAAGESAKSVSVQVIVNPALTVTPPTIDPFDQGQTAHIQDTLQNDGTAPYSYNFLVESPGALSFVTANSICPSQASGSNQAANTVETCNFATNSITKTGTYQIEFQVTDSKGVTHTSTPVPLQLNTTPTVTLIPSNSPLGIGQTETLKAQLTGGVGPFTVNIMENGNVVDTLTNIPYNGFGTYTFDANNGGTLTFNAVGTDMGTTVPDVFNSTKLSIPVNSQFSVGVTPTTFNADMGQPVSFNAIVTGGLAPYTYKWTFKGNSVGTNSIYLTFNAATSGSVKLVATDSESPAASGNAVASLAIVGNALSVSISPTSGSIANGAQQTFTSNVAGGTGSYAYQWYNDTTGTPVAIAGATANAITINGQAAGTFTYYLAVSDLGTTGPYTVDSNSAQLAVAAPQPTGGGPSGSGGGGGGGGGNFVPVITNFTAGGQICSLITNMTQDNGVTLLLRNIRFTVTENYITPTSAGVTIDGTPYEIKNGSSVSLGDLGGNNYTATLKSISYLPILQTISLEICSPVPPAPIQAPPVPLTVNITGNIITAKGPSNDLITILANNESVATGTGIATYNALDLLPGIYGISARDNTSNTVVSLPKPFDRQKYVPVLTFTGKCANQTYVPGFSCITTASITGTAGKLLATLYLNGNVVGSTTGIMSSTSNSIGTYKYVFETQGNANYSAENISYTYSVKGATKAATPSSGLWKYLPEIAVAVLAIIAALSYILYKRRRKAVPANITKVDLDEI